jgi:hypothetical protein
MRARVHRLRHRGTVLVIVLVTLLFAAFALIIFMDKAGNDLLVEQRDAETHRLRREAYSALEVTLAVLEEFRGALNGLRSPAEGWSDPLAFAGYTPTEGRKVEIAFEDESGKISLPHANAVTLTNLFKNWQIQQADAEALTDALLGWMQANHTYISGLAPSYEQATIPYLPPARPLRSFQELAAIDKIRETFYDEDGRPNDLWKRFADAVSLLNFQRPNINGAKPDTLAAVAQFDPTQQQNLTDYLNGTGMYQAKGPGYFQSAGEAMRIAAGASGDTTAFAPTISALRIFVIVHDGQSVFRLAAVVAPPGGATTVQTNATSQRAPASGTNTRNAANQQDPNQRNNNSNQAPNPGGASTRQNANPNAANLRYPFTLLEIRENDEIPPPPPPPPPDPTL